MCLCSTIQVELGENFHHVYSCMIALSSLLSTLYCAILLATQLQVCWLKFAIVVLHATWPCTFPRCPVSSTGQHRSSTGSQCGRACQSSFIVSHITHTGTAAAAALDWQQPTSGCNLLPACQSYRQFQWAAAAADSAQQQCWVIWGSWQQQRNATN